MSAIRSLLIFSLITLSSTMSCSSANLSFIAETDGGGEKGDTKAYASLLPKFSGYGVVRHHLSAFQHVQKAGLYGRNNALSQYIFFVIYVVVLQPSKGTK